MFSSISLLSLSLHAICHYSLLSLGCVRTTYAANFRSILRIKLLCGLQVGQRLGTFAYVTDVQWKFRTFPVFESQLETNIADRCYVPILSKLNLSSLVSRRMAATLILLFKSTIGPAPFTFHNRINYSTSTRSCEDIQKT